MQARTLLTNTLKGLTALALAMSLNAQAQGGPKKVAVTDLAYTQAVAEYFEVGTFQSSAEYHASLYHASASAKSSGTYAAGVYSYMEQRELGSFTNDIKVALLKGTNFQLVQGQGFDAGAPQPTKAEQVLNQVKTGKVATPVRQPQVMDIIARIRKGEFNSADYVLFGTLTSAEFRDTLSPLQGTSSVTHQFSLDILADFSLINTKTYEIKSAFSAQGAGVDTKILSTRGDVVPPNRAMVMRQTSQSLAASVFEQIADQLSVNTPNALRPAAGYGTAPMVQGQQQMQQPTPITILR
jgi:curli biogenesis system outer membrane secretion channel CsgG